MPTVRHCDQCGGPIARRGGRSRFCSRTCFGLDRRGRTVWGVPTLSRFWSKVGRRGPDECWPWLGSRQASGHGQFVASVIPHRLTPAHKFMWQLTHGPIGDGLVVCHRCDHGWCVNPTHLFVGTQADNLRDCREKDRHSRGERHYNAKLTDDNVTEMRRLASVGVAQVEIARRFNTDQSHVSNIMRGKKWRHLLGEVA